MKDVNHKFKHSHRLDGVDGIIEQSDGDNASSDLHQEIHHSISETEILNEVEEVMGGKSKPVKKPKKPHQNRTTYNILPFHEPRKRDCGTFLDFNYAHVSIVPDIVNSEGETVHSAHVIGPADGGNLPESMRINCNSITCEFCNSEHDIHGNPILGEDGHPKPAGTFKKTVLAHADKLTQMQKSIGNIMSGEYPQNFRDALKFFYSKHKTNHPSGKVFYTLIDKQMGPKQRENLQATLRYAAKRHISLSIYHVVLSPPKTWTDWETEDGMSKNTKRAIGLLREVGCFGGYIYHHPFRIPGEFNERDEVADGPHWHFVGFSHIMPEVESTIYEREKVIIKNLHRNKGHVEPVRSVYQTIAYILSHTGVQVYRDPILQDFNLMEKYHLVNSPEVPSGKRFILPSGESNFQIPLPLHIDPEVFKDSLSYHEFLKTDTGYAFQLLRRQLLSYLQGKDKSDYLSSIRSNISKKGKKILMRNFGVLSNSKNFIWGFKREKPKYYCRLCKTHVPLKDMLPVHVFSDSLYGIKGPPPSPDPYEKASAEDREFFAVLDAYERAQQQRREEIMNLTQPNQINNNPLFSSLPQKEREALMNQKNKPILYQVPAHKLHEFYPPAEEHGEVYVIP